MQVKSIALANGDYYVKCQTDFKNDQELLEAIKESEFIKITAGGHTILINSEFIVSICL